MDKAINVGGDPRNFLEFAEIRDEINKMNHPSTPEVDFEFIRRQAEILFTKNGLDLQTVGYFLLASTKLEGVPGFISGIETLERLLRQPWQSVWPNNDIAKIDILDWINNRAGYHVRTFSYKTQHVPLLIQLERPLKKIVDVLTDLQLKKQSGLSELHKFVKNTRETLEERATAGLRAERKKAVLPIIKEIKAPISQPVTVIEAPQTIPSAEENGLPSAETMPSRLSVWHGFFFGIVSAGVVFLMLAYNSAMLQAKFLTLDLFSPLTQDEVQRYARDLGANPLWRKQSRLENYQRQLGYLSQGSVLASHRFADNLLALTAEIWPDSYRAYDLKVKWQTQLENLRNEHELSDGHSQTKRRIGALIKQINQSEKNATPMQLAQIKSSLYVIQRQLNEYQPVEDLLKQLSTDKRNSQALVLQIDAKLGGLLSHYYALTQDITDASA